jgi:hypothetical protein
VDLQEFHYSLPLYPRVYYRPTDLHPLPHLISAVFTSYKQNNVQLNYSLPAAQFATPQLKVLTSIHLSIPTPLAGPIIKNPVTVFS